MAVIQPDEEYIPQSLEPSHPSPISTPPMNSSTIEVWETPHTTRDDHAFYSEHEPRRVYWDIPSTSTIDSNDHTQLSFIWNQSSSTPPPRRQKRKMSMGMSFPKRGGESQHDCEACGQPRPETKETLMLRGKFKHEDY